MASMLFSTGDGIDASGLLVAGERRGERRRHVRHTRETCVMPMNDAAFGLPTIFWRQGTAMPKLWLHTRKSPMP
jgi:hypothetical protein